MFTKQNLVLVLALVLSILFCSVPGLDPGRWAYEDNMTSSLGNAAWKTEIWANDPGVSMDPDGCPRLA